MNNREKILHFVNKVHSRLISEHLFRVIQTALSFGLILSAIVYVTSRLFVFPYFQLWALGAGTLGFMVLFIWGGIVKPSYTTSLHRFDQYFPDNILLTSLHAREDESGLLESLREKTAHTVNLSFDIFKRRKKHLWRVKSLTGIGMAIVVLLLLIAFPSTTQLLAKDIEMEKELVEQIKKEVAKTVKKNSPSTLKKELQQLQKDLDKTETTEEALRELIKKQKELQLREQKLVAKLQAAKNSGNAKGGLTVSEKKELAALKTATKDLADRLKPFD
jgi:regulator of replication initiation timing